MPTPSSRLLNPTSACQHPVQGCPPQSLYVPTPSSRFDSLELGVGMQWWGSTGCGHVEVGFDLELNVGMQKGWACSGEVQEPACRGGVRQP